MESALSEADARTLCRAIVKELVQMHARVTNMGVYLDREGFTFRAEINGHDVWVFTGQGNFEYRRVAAELLNEALYHGQEFANPELRIVTH